MSEKWLTVGSIKTIGCRHEEIKVEYRFWEVSEQLYWHCECGNNEPAQPEYEHWDSEPYCLCENGVARVVTIKEAAAWEQARALGHSWRPKRGSALTTACQECRGKGQVVVGFGFPGDEFAGATSVEDCDRCGGTGRLR